MLGKVPASNKRAMEKNRENMILSSAVCFSNSLLNRQMNKFVFFFLIQLSQNKGNLQSFAKNKYYYNSYAWYKIPITHGTRGDF